ncbi:RagB/SusD family nutrient uptake outer membrane protein [Olivibacter sp. 47]|uniref:RagB/SusD family nutrient uptake outer membrane protein n=1 Tax=Olivibacter sp. 47 TaxID=3056486 RepID=UPI0025A4A68F|nr:RagB/SusD family nutrient uptake outer membrane protein [Olivibacter sp. 47]MDM8175977.1 RagB/SusD family nutrient uptake outer membrane protein [Olivibacter sp. 47]
MRLCIFLFFANCILLGSCNDFVDVDTPPNQLTRQSVFINATSIEAGLAGIYSNLSGINHSLNAEMHIGTSLYSDELHYSGSLQQYLDFEASAIQTNNTIISGVWADTYQTIYSINDALEGIANSQLAESITNPYIGELKFLRSFCYFNLINLYGDVPLITGVDFEINSSLPRTPTNEIYDQIVIDLKDALTLLPRLYVGSEKRSRPNYFAACALMARVSLFMQNWQDSYLFSSEVINDDNYSLGDLSQVFLKDSPETIWQLIPVTTPYNTNIGRLTVPLNVNNNAIPDFFLSDNMLSNFEQKDLRAANWIGIKTVNEQKYYFPYKYKINTSSEVTEFLIVFRLVEQYLIRAEALIEQGKLPEAKRDLEIVRSRAGLPPLTIELDSEKLRSALMHEKKLELFLEWGLTWFDKRRLRQNNLEDYWPIPLTELERNPNLEQNTQY